MTNEEKQVQIALGTYLPYMWKERNKLADEGDKLIDEGYKLRNKRRELTVEGNKLLVEGRKLIVEGNLLYSNAVIEVYGNKAVIFWKTGEVKHDS